MQFIFLDFETHYTDEYSLRKMTPVEYVLDARFECHGCAVKLGVDEPAYWIDGPDLPAFFATLNPNDVAMVSHNALFDQCIVAWRYGFTPKLIVDTLAIARACFGHELKSLSLNSVAMYLGLGKKGDVLYMVKGMSLAMIKADPGLYNVYMRYACQDVDFCAEIFRSTVRTGLFPPVEMVWMDMVLRCALQPRFMLDEYLLAEHLHMVREKKDLLLAQVMLATNAEGKSDLTSNDGFAQLLRAQGVDPPTKVSPATGRTTWAFAKTDMEFMELAEHENPIVQILIQARLGHKTTLEESRTDRMLNIANLTWPDGLRHCWMPVPHTSAAHTHRLGGAWQLNMQNLPRSEKLDDGTKRPSKLRRALIAPPGYSVVVADSSQIEARLVAWISKCWTLINQFAAGEDVYSSFASHVFGFVVTRHGNPSERFVGKQGVLGLGYGLGHVKFQLRLKTDSLNQTGRAIVLSDEASKNVVDTYRTIYHEVPTIWRSLQYSGIPVLLQGGVYEIGPCRFEERAVSLPGGLKLHYHNLYRADSSGNDWMFTYGGLTYKLYGGKLLENIVQALARTINRDAAIRIQKRKTRFAMQSHDELAYIVPNEAVPEMEGLLMEEMTRRPTWAPDLPLAAEVGHGPNYGEAK